MNSTGQLSVLLLLFKGKNVPQLFAAQDFDVATALLDLSTSGPVRLQVLVIKGDLDEGAKTIVSPFSVVSCGHVGLVDLRSHLTSFAQEVYWVVCFQEGRHCEAVEERQITVCVSLCLQQSPQLVRSYN